MKRERQPQQAKRVGDRAKGTAKWHKEEVVDIMIHLERSLKGHTQIAKQKMEHLLVKRAKQIRDKRREPSYKALVEQYDPAPGATRGPLESTCSISDSETEICPVTTK